MATSTATLPGYFFRPAHHEKLDPTIILTTGYDGTCEETYFSDAVAALRRGYNCVLYDGPGQGRALRLQRLTIRPDWEHVVMPVVDYALTLRGVDPARIVIAGASLAGYLAPRAATAEHRLAACIADPGQFDLGDAIPKRLPPPIAQAFAAGNAAVVNSILDHVKDPSQRFFFTSRMVVHGTPTVFELLQALTQFSLGGIADRIACPTMVTDAAGDDVASGSARQLYDALTCPKVYVPFTAEEGAENHCESGARSLAHQRMFDWLDETLRS